jgi:hypothetical protein
MLGASGTGRLDHGEGRPHALRLSILEHSAAHTTEDPSEA